MLFTSVWVYKKLPKHNYLKIILKKLALERVCERQKLKTLKGNSTGSAEGNLLSFLSGKINHLMINKLFKIRIIKPMQICDK